MRPYWESDSLSPMVNRTRAKKKVVEVPQLRYNGENWSHYCEKLFQAAEAQNLLGLLNSTNPNPSDLEPWNLWCIAMWLRNNTEAQYLLVTTTPAVIWDHFTISTVTAHNMFTYLKNLFEKPMDVEVTHTAAHSWEPFSGTCQRCREPGHKVQECNKAEKRLGQSQVEKTSHGRSRKQNAEKIR